MPPTTYIDIALQIKINNLVHCPSVKRTQDFGYRQTSCDSADEGSTYGLARHAALFDREARLRGLKLAAADFIDVLNGERERRAREFLESVTGKRLATKAEWENFFSGNPPPPWTMTS